MPPVVIAVVAAAGAIGAGVAIGTAIAIGLAAGALSSVMSMKIPAAPDVEDVTREQQLHTSAAAPRRAIVGETTVSGLIVGYGKADNKHHMVVEIAGHPCEALEIFEIEGKSAAEIGNKVKMTAYLGSQTTAHAAFKTTVHGWTDTHVGNNQTYVALEIDIDNEMFPSGINKALFKVKGRKVYDPRLDSTVGGSGSHRADDETTWQWSDNSELIAFDFARLRGYKVQPLRRFDLSHIAAQANICDELVTFKDNGVDKTEKRFTCNGSYNFNEQTPQVLKKILSSMGGKPYRSGAILKLQAAAYAGVSTTVLTSNDAAGEINYRPNRPLRERTNFVRGVYVDPTLKYQPTDCTPQTSSLYTTQDKDVALERDLQLHFTQSETMAQRLCKIDLERNRAGFVVEFPAKSVGLECSPGKVITLNIPEDNIINKTFIVEDWTYDHSTKITNLVLAEDSAELYSDSLVPTLKDLTPNLVMPDVFTVTAVTDIAFTPTQNDITRQGYFSWKHPNANEVDHYWVDIRTANNDVVVEKKPQVARLDVADLPADNYVLTVYAVNRWDRKSEASSLLFTFAVPVAPTLNVVSTETSKITLNANVTPRSIGTIFEWEFRGANDTDNSNTVISQQFTVAGLNNDTTYYFRCRVVNMFGVSTWTNVFTKTLINDPQIDLDVVQNTVFESVVNEFQDEFDRIASNPTQLITDTINLVFDNFDTQLTVIDEKNSRNIETKSLSEQIGQAQSNIENTNQAIADESSARATATAQITAQITDETNTRSAQINSVQESVVDEASARAFDINQVASAIVNEVNTRAAQINSVQQSVVDEASARATDMATVSAQITDETNARSAAVTTINQAIATKADQSSLAAVDARVTNNEDFSASALLELTAHANAIDGLQAQVFLGVDVNGQIGIFINGSATDNSIDLLSNRVHFINPDTGENDLTYNATNKLLEFGGTVKAKHLSGDLDDVSVITTIDQTWTNTSDKRVLATFSVNNIDFVRTLIVPPIFIEGGTAQTFTLHLEEQTTLEAPWSIIDNVLANGYQASVQVISRPMSRLVAADTTRYFRITAQPTQNGNAVIYSQPIILTLVKNGNLIQ